jgi:ParB family transcriptional regulator, chromosome partitioning protein
MTATAPTLELQELELAEIHESPWNPRQQYDQAKLAELADSLKSGQLTPVLVRPRTAGGFELAAGHRRFRAAKLAGLPTLLAIVRTMEDARFLEVLVIENDQRDDLHPLEEARGFTRLLKQGGYDIPRIAERIGRSVQYVYDRVKLLQLTKEAQALFLAGEMTAGHAILLARLAPADQARALSDKGVGNGYRVGGLFQSEIVLAVKPGEELALGDRRKPVSVRELQGWIDHNVRFRPDQVDLPTLFPATLEALTAAPEAELKVVKITRDYRVSDEARDEKERTYGLPSWKRADGESEVRYDGRKVSGKPCDHVVLGVVVAGPGRGEAFRVCVAKKTCAIHWAAEQREAAKRGNKSAPATGAAPQRQRWEIEQEREKAERQRWAKARPALLAAFEEALAKADAGPTSKLAAAVLRACGARVVQDKGPTSHEALVRVAASAALTRHFRSNDWSLVRDAPAALQVVGLRAKTIVDQVAAVDAKREKKSTASKSSGKPKRTRSARGK